MMKGTLWSVENDHTYSLPSLKKEDPLLPIYSKHTNIDSRSEKIVITGAKVVSKSYRTCHDSSHILLMQQVFELEQRCEALEADKKNLQKLLNTKAQECKTLLSVIHISKTTIYDIPMDCLMIIFEYVNDIDLLETTCDYWKRALAMHRRRFVKPCLYYIKHGNKVHNGILNSYIIPDRTYYLHETKDADNKSANWYEHNWTSMPVSLDITNRPTGISIAGIMKEAINYCPDWWLRNVRKLSLHDCRLTDDFWNQLVKRLPNLENLHVKVKRRGIDSLSLACRVPMCELIDAVGNQIHTVCFDAFNYRMETKLVENLISKSYLTREGLRLILIESSSYENGRMRFYKCLPMREIIKLVERAKFNVDVYLSFEQPKRGHLLLIQWLEKKNLWQRPSNFTHPPYRFHYHFQYRGSTFGLQIVTIN